MLSAALFGDQPAFERIYDWTRGTLKRPYDALHAWRFRPGAAIPVDDPNNATDGDLLIGLALFLAAERWSCGAYHAAGLEIAKDVLRLLVREANDRYVLLPGQAGFDGGAALTVNPSYYVFPALRCFAQQLPDAAWPKLWADGLAFLHEARFGRWKLTPDWVSLPLRAGPVIPASQWPARFSFDAVRLPLYMCWAGLISDPAVESVKGFWNAHGGSNCPAWIDVKSGEVAPYTLTGGMLSIQRYVLAATSGAGQMEQRPAVAQASDYYSAALTMLVHVAGKTGFSVIS